MAKVTIERIETPAKENLPLVIHVAGSKTPIKVWRNSSLVKMLEDGKEYELGIEKKEGKYGEERWLQTVNGEKGVTPQKGGGKPPAQRTNTETYSIMAQTAVKDARLWQDARALQAGEKTGVGDQVVVSTAHKLFDAMLEMVERGQSKLGV